MERPQFRCSSMCQTLCDLIMVMWNADAVKEVKYEILVEECVRHPEANEMYEIQRNAGRLFLHEDLWDRWSRGFSFSKEMFFPEGRILLQVESRLRHREVCNKDRRTERVTLKNVVMPEIRRERLSP